MLSSAAAKSLVPAIITMQSPVRGKKQGITIAIVFPGFTSAESQVSVVTISCINHADSRHACSLEIIVSFINFTI